MFKDTSNNLHISKNEEFILTDCGFVNISCDDWAENPRNYCDCLFNIVSFDRYYQFDYNEFYDVDDFLFQTKKDYIRFSLFIFGDELNFNEDFDEDACFFAYVSREKILKEYNVKRISKNVLEKVKDVLKAELFELSCFLRGEIYYIYFNNEELEEENFGGVIGSSLKDNGLDYYFGNVYLSFDEGNKPDEDDIEDLKHFNFYSKQLGSEFEIEDLDTCISISKDSLEEIFLKENFLNEVFDEKTCSKLKRDLRLSIVNCLKKVYRSEI